MIFQPNTLSYLNWFSFQNIFKVNLALINIKNRRLITEKFIKSAEKFKNKCFIESRLIKWLVALGMVSSYITDCEFHADVEAIIVHHFRPFIDHKIPTIAVSEPSVERCFSMHTQAYQTSRCMIFCSSAMIIPTFTSTFLKNLMLMNKPAFMKIEDC